MERRIFKTAPKLKLVQLLSAGYDRIDIEAARRAACPYATMAGANSTAVSEHAIMLMLAVSRKPDLAAWKRVRRTLAWQQCQRGQAV